MEITAQTSQTVPGQQSIKKQGSRVDTPANVVSEAKNIISTNDAKPVSESLKEYQKSEIENKVSQLNDHMQNLDRNLQFSVDEQSGSSVITIRDTETEEIIRQFPSDEVLNARSAIERVKGLLLETKA